MAESQRVITATFPVPASPEIVFDVLTDPGRMTRWLPRGVSGELSDENVVRITTQSGAVEFRRFVDPDRLRLVWSPIDGGSVGGWLRVRDANSGASVVEVEVQLGTAGVHQDRIRDSLAEAATHLRRDVADNFTAG